MTKKSTARKKRYFGIPLFLMLTFVLSCNHASVNNEATTDSTSVTTDQSTTGSNDVIHGDTATVTGQEPDSLIPAPVPPEKSPQKGIAMIYCPAKMIRNIPSIISATISREEMSKAVDNFIQKVQEQNQGIRKEVISRDIKSDSIDIYDKMGVDIEFDPDDFVEILKSKNDSVKEFGNKQTLDWEWTIKPLHSTEKSIIKFEFYYVDPDNRTNLVLEKTISVVATVDARSFVDRWKDFLFEDSKTTITAILIPFITFLGGFFSGKKKK